MKQLHRRKFLQQAGVLGLTASAVSLAGPSSAANGANERLNLAVIGCGGQGSSLGRGFTGQPNSRVAYVCDPDQNRRDRLKQALGADHAVSDLRKILDDKGVDAVAIATPDHWHAPAAILACEAGKHVYVEKPCSHNFHESQLLLKAARRNNVVVQHGTQCRSVPLIANAVQLLREGVIGEVLVAKAWNIQRRSDSGRRFQSIRTRF